MVSERSHKAKRWLAFYVRPRHEKKVAERLSRNGIEVFCPLVCIKVRWSDRWKKIQKPVINGYLFARLTEKERCEVVEDPGVIRTVFWKGRPALIRDEEIEFMRYMLREGGNAKMEPIQPGDRIKVADGGKVLGISGMEGVVVKVYGNEVSIQIESKHAQLSMTVSRKMVRCLDMVGK